MMMAVVLKNRTRKECLARYNAIEFACQNAFAPRVRFPSIFISLSVFVTAANLN